MRYAALVAALVGLSNSLLQTSAPPRLAGCPVFPESNAWNRRVDALPAAPNSDAIIRSIGLGTGLHADFGSGLWDGSPIGIPTTS